MESYFSMNKSIIEIMQNNARCSLVSEGLHEKLTSDVTVKSMKFKILPRRENSFCFRIEFTTDVYTELGEKISGMSISIPPDAMGNRGPQPPYFESEIPSIIETILIGESNDFV